MGVLLLYQGRVGPLLPAIVLWSLVSGSQFRTQIVSSFAVPQIHTTMTMKTMIRSPLLLSTVSVAMSATVQDIKMKKHNIIIMCV